MCGVYKLFKCTLFKAGNMIRLFAYKSVYMSMYIVRSLLLQGKVVSLLFKKKTFRRAEQYSFMSGLLKRNYLRSTVGYG
jgi:hypothetical protein